MLDITDRSVDVLERLPPAYRLIARFSSYVDVEALLSLPESATDFTHHRHHRTEGETAPGALITLTWSIFPQVGRDVTIPTSLLEEYRTYRYDHVAHALCESSGEETSLFYHRGQRVSFPSYLQEIALAEAAAYVMRRRS